MSLTEPGLVLTTSQVTVRAGRLTRTTLREAAGGTVELRVVDARGEGLPYATLELPWDTSWVDLREGVQRIDPFTDLHGRRTLRRFPAGKWQFQAIYGSRRAKGQVEVTDGATVALTLTID